MTFSPVMIITLAAFAVAVVSAMGKAPLWVAVMLIAVVQLIMAAGVR